jgi:hypothetical protein
MHFRLKTIPGKTVAIASLSLAFVLIAGTAFAALTFNSTAITSDGALTLNPTGQPVTVNGNLTVTGSCTGCGGGGTPGGSNTQIQFNNSGAFGGSANLTWDGSKLTVNATGGAPITLDGKNIRFGSANALNGTGQIFGLSDIEMVPGFPNFGIFSNEDPNAIFSFDANDPGDHSGAFYWNSYNHTNVTPTLTLVPSTVPVLQFGDGNGGSHNAVNGLFQAAGLLTTPTTVSGLPACNTGAKSQRQFVTDATATTFMSTVVGGGSNNVPVVCDGTNWKIGG